MFFSHIRGSILREKENSRKRFEVKGKQKSRSVFFLLPILPGLNILRENA